MGVEFENQYVSNRSLGLSEGETGLVGLFIKLKLAKDRNQALIVMLIVGVVVLIASIFVFVKFALPQRYEMSPEERVKADARIKSIESRYR